MFRYVATPEHVSGQLTERGRAPWVFCLRPAPYQHTRRRQISGRSFPRPSSSPTGWLLIKCRMGVRSSASWRKVKLRRQKRLGSCPHCTNVKVPIFFAAGIGVTKRRKRIPSAHTGGRSRRTIRCHAQGLGVRRKPRSTAHATQTVRPSFIRGDLRGPGNTRTGYGLHSPPTCLQARHAVWLMCLCHMRRQVGARRRESADRATLSTVLDETTLRMLVPCNQRSRRHASNVRRRDDCRAMAYTSRQLAAHPKDAGGSPRKLLGATMAIVEVVTARSLGGMRDWAPACLFQGKLRHDIAM